MEMDGFMGGLINIGRFFCEGSLQPDSRTASLIRLIFIRRKMTNCSEQAGFFLTTNEPEKPSFITKPMIGTLVK